MFNFEHKMQFHKDKVRAAIREDGINDSLSTVFIDLVSGVCNHKCIFCDGEFNPIEKKIFSKDKLSEIANDLISLGVNSVIIVGEGGESLLNPNFEFFAKLLLDHKVHIGIYTNGGMLDESKVDVISKFDFIRFSLDSGSQKTHKEIHGYDGDRDDFNSIFKRIKCLRKRSDIQIGASFILLPQNVDEIYSAAKKLKRAGANYIEIKPAYLSDYNFNLNAFKLILKKFNVQIEKARELEDGSFKIWVNNQLKDVMSNNVTMGQNITKLKHPRECLTRRLRLVISPTGCYVCPPNRSKKNFRVGDIQKNSLKSIWGI